MDLYLTNLSTSLEINRTDKKGHAFKLVSQKMVYRLGGAHAQMQYCIALAGGVVGRQPGVCRCFSCPSIDG